MSSAPKALNSGSVFALIGNLKTVLVFSKAKKVAVPSQSISIKSTQTDESIAQRSTTNIGKADSKRRDDSAEGKRNVKK